MELSASSTPSGGASKLAVLTASSNSGSACIEMLLSTEAGPEIQALFRSEEKANALQKQYPNDWRLKTRTGIDANDKPTMTSAMEGCNMEFVITPHDARAGIQDDAKLTINMIDAAVQAGVRHVILVTSWTLIAKDQLSLLAGRFQPAEDFLQDCGRSHNLSWTILRGGFFNNKFAAFEKSVKERDASVDPWDIGRVAASIALQDGYGHHGRVYDISAPVAHGLKDVTGFLSMVLKREIRFFDQGVQECVKDLPPFLKELYVYLHGAFEKAIPTSDDIVKVTGRVHVDLNTWIQRNKGLFED